MLSIRKPLCVSIILACLLLNPSWSRDTGEELIELSGIQGGLVVVLNDEKLTSEIQINDRYLYGHSPWAAMDSAAPVVEES